MIKKVSAICLFVFLCVFCMSATIETDNLETASYAEDGLVLDTDEMQFEDNQLENMNLNYPIMLMLLIIKLLLIMNLLKN